MDILILALLDLAERLRGFIDSGGSVLVAIGVVIFLMWALILERLAYVHYVFPRQAARLQALWDTRVERISWQAHQIRLALLAGIRLDAQSCLPVIKTLVAICPLMGLLGTVTGMIAVFDVMAFSGMGNPRLMASGVSQATIPTMAGMVGALSGVFAIHALEAAVKRRVELLGDRLTMDH